jgi:hypothetical protein
MLRLIFIIYYKSYISVLNEHCDIRQITLTEGEGSARLTSMLRQMCKTDKTDCVMFCNADVL